jgi:protein SCO1/2
MQRPRLLTAFIILAIVVILSAVYFYMKGAASPPPTPGVNTSSSGPSIGGPFALVDQDGKRVTDQDFRGRFMLVYFGYTHCPDQCPLGLETLTKALEEMPAEAAGKVQPLFVTVDPERDTPAVMKDYVANVYPRLIGLTGSPDEVTGVVKSYRMYVKKNEPEKAGGDYLVDHTAFTFLMGKDGRYLAHFSAGTTAEEMAKRTTALVDGDGGSSATS